MGVAFTYCLKDWKEGFDICVKILLGPDKD